MKVRPIDANALGNYKIEISKEIMECNPDIKETFAIFGAAIDRQPTLDYEPVVHAHWFLEREPNGSPYCFHCSNCDSDSHYIGIKTAYDFCPNCGAKMDEEVKE